MGKNNWQEDLRRIQSAIQNLLTIGVPDFHHAMLLSESVDWLTDSYPHCYGANGPMVERIVVQKANSTPSIHYFFRHDDYRMVVEIDQGFLTKFKTSIRSLPSVLENVPRSVVPKLSLNRTENGNDDAMIYWLTLLHWFAVNREFGFKVHLDCLPTEKLDSKNLNFDELSNMSMLPSFDPIEMFCSANDSSSTFAAWQSKHWKAGHQFPATIASSLTKPVLYASGLAIEFILRCVQRSVDSTADKIAKEVRKIHAPNLNAFDIDVINILLLHHEPKWTTSNPNYTPLTQEQIIVQLHPEYADKPREIKKMQSSVSRALKRIFDSTKPPSKSPTEGTSTNSNADEKISSKKTPRSTPMKEYGRKCGDRTIVAFLLLCDRQCAANQLIKEYADPNDSHAEFEQ